MWVQQDRIRACGYAVIGEAVGLVADADGRVRYKGLAHCGSVWACPTCGMVIKAGRAEEIRHVVEEHGKARCVLVSLTLSHGRGDELGKLRVDLADAWRGMTRGKGWRLFKERFGVEGAIRALELTHGTNGWHPHLHVVLLLSEAIPDAELMEWPPGSGKTRWTPAGLTWLVDRWRTMVVRYVGWEHGPSDEHGCVLTPCHRGDYLAKLGLELADPGNKKGRRPGHRTPLEIAHDYAQSGDEELGALWREYRVAMKGARQLTWSRGLKRRFGIRDRTDLEVAQDEEAAADLVEIGTMSREQWGVVRVAPPVRTHRGRMPADVWILAMCELHGAMALGRCLVRLGAA